MKLLPLLLLTLSLAVCERPPRPEVNHSAHDHNTSGHGNTSHSHKESSPGAGAAPHELQFIDTMIAHHQGAIDMAVLVKTRTRRPEMLKLAAGIIEEQQREIARLREWRRGWYGDARPAVNLDFPGMQLGMSGMDMAKLDPLKAAEFDQEFLRQMIPHHEGAVEMAKALNTDDRYKELKELADSIIRSQTAEIEQMRKWLDEWRSK